MLNITILTAHVGIWGASHLSQTRFISSCFIDVSLILAPSGGAVDGIHGLAAAQQGLFEALRISIERRSQQEVNN